MKKLKEKKYYEKPSDRRRRQIQKASRKVSQPR